MEGWFCCHLCCCVYSSWPLIIFLYLKNHLDFPILDSSDNITPQSTLEASCVYSKAVDLWALFVSANPPLPVILGLIFPSNCQPIIVIAHFVTQFTHIGALSRKQTKKFRKTGLTIWSLGLLVFKKLPFKIKL